MKSWLLYKQGTGIWSRLRLTSGSAWTSRPSTIRGRLGKSGPENHNQCQARLLQVVITRKGLL
jgi:hypothetical protein